MQVTGAEVFVKALLCEKVDTLFAYPGGQVIDLFNALYGVEGIDVILPRHEQGLIHAADGYARSTGKVGVCLVTSGPGATNLVTGIATANYDCVPLICFTGQVPTHLIGNRAFQEVDTLSIVKSVTKYAVTVRRREELAGTIRKAFCIARSGRPGVVVVDLPKDIQQAAGSDAYPGELGDGLDAGREEGLAVEGRDGKGYGVRSCGHGISGERVKVLLDCLSRAERPLFLAGGGVRAARAGKEMTALAEKTGIPVVTTIMGMGVLPTDHPLYVGNLGVHGSYAANMAVSGCDVLFSIGVRFSDRITGKAEEFAKNAVIIHVDIEPESASRDVKADITVKADAKEAIVGLLDRAEELECGGWRREIREWGRKRPLAAGQCGESGVTPLAVMGKINALFSDAVITTDVGQNQLWATQFLELTQGKQMLTSGGLGTMGYGFPAAIGAKLGNPGKDVIAICGDGGIQMTAYELATAVTLELPVIVCILNNGYLGNVRQWQEMFYDRRYFCTCLRRRRSCPDMCSAPDGNCPEYTPDFVRLAESYGARGIRVREWGEIEGAFMEAKCERKVPVVIEFIIGREENVLPIVPPGKGIGEMVFDTRYNLC